MMDEDENESEGKTQPSHVFKTDHLGLDLWMDLAQKCYMSWGREQEFINNVDAYKASIRNMYNGPALKDILNKNIKEKIEPKYAAKYAKWVKAHPQESRIEEEVNAQEEVLRILIAEDILQEIDQLLEDYGYISHGAKVIRTYR